MTDSCKFDSEDLSLNLQSEIASLLTKLGVSRVEPVAYDTAWIARLGHIDADLAAQALAWLRTHQLPDGGWGAAMPLYHHDRVINTLSAVIALARNGAPEDETRIARGVVALNRSLDCLESDVSGRTIAFEMLLPTLVAEARSLGLQINDPHNAVSIMSAMRDAKLARAPRGQIDRSTSMGFSTEMVGLEGLHLLDLDNVQQDDGSISVSPAATAFFVASVRPDPAALQYLHRVTRDGGAPTITSIDHFEPAWALWNLTRGCDDMPEISAFGNRLLDQLAAEWDDTRGISLASSFAVPDGDDTGIIFELLARFNRNPNLAALWYYEEESHFRCLDFENHLSISTNVHILGALRAAGLQADHPAVQKVASFLEREKTPARAWVDKWHASPYYPTSHAIIACAGYLDELACSAVEWLLHTQNEDGSWGYHMPTAEETAYSMQALLTWYQSGNAVPKAVLARGAAWLLENAHPPYAPLWISKSLYCPTLVVQSAILGALRQYELTFGALP